MNKLTDIELKSQLYYNPLIGDFTRLVSNVYTVKIGDIAGSKRKDGYIYIRLNKNRYLAHRLAWLYIYGYFPENDIDHINRVRDDNRIINLREASRQCNIRNSNTRLDNKSGIVGVCWHKLSNKWQARITVNGKRIHLGYFFNRHEAAKVRWEAEVEYGFPNCNTTSTAYKYLKGE